MGDDAVKWPDVMRPQSAGKVNDNKKMSLNLYAHHSAAAKAQYS